MDKKKTEKDWEAVITDWKNSGMRRKDFCDSRKLKLTTFDYWKRKIIKPEREEAGFVRIKRKGSSSHSIGRFRITIQNKYTVDVPESFRNEDLIRIVKILEAAG
jgi:hypothetical protein